MAAGGKRASAGASSSRPLHPLHAWLQHHRTSLRAGLATLAHSPFSALLTAGVIGIALALPAGLFVLLNSLQPFGSHLDGSASISVFLKQDLDAPASQALARSLRARPDIAAVDGITRSQALAEFRRLSKFKDALDALPDNPLPAVLVVHPAPGHSQPASLKALAGELRRSPQADMVQLDMEWVQRLNALTRLGQRGIEVIAGLLGLAVLLIVGNTIRLDIQNRHAEIEITKLIGGTDAFIRRPFLWGGLCYGVAGGLAGNLLVGVALWLLSGPAERLSALYDSALTPPSLDPLTALALLAAGALLGLGGAWLAVTRHLRRIEPA